MGFVARRDSIHQYTFLASRPSPLGLPSKLIYRRYSALGYFSNMQSGGVCEAFAKIYCRTPAVHCGRQFLFPNDSLVYTIEKLWTEMRAIRAGTTLADKNYFFETLVVWGVRSVILTFTNRQCPAYRLKINTLWLFK